MSKSYAESNSYLSSLIAGPLYMGLSSTTPSADGTGITEPSGGGYARIDAASLFSGATPASGSVSNTVAGSFAVSTGAWASGADLTHVVFYSASTAGTFKRYAALSTARKVDASGITITIDIGDIVFSES
jgi:hypothetical protein